MRTALLLLFVTISNFANSQNITFDQAQNLRKKSLAEVETFLTAKSWSMTEAEEASADKMGNATFGFNVDQFDSEKATGWIVFCESRISNNYNRLSIQIIKPSLYSAFLSRLTPNAYKLKSSKIVDGGIKKIYSNATTTCVVTTSTSEGTYTKSTTYSFFFIDNFSYKLNFEDEE
jgi:hypothetical protein